MRRNKAMLFVLASLIGSTGILAQNISVPGVYLYDFNKLNDTTKLAFYSSIREKPGQGFQWLDPFVKSTYNSGYVRSYDDGANWRGRGLNLEGYAGFQGKLGAFSYTFYPQVGFAQNMDTQLLTDLINQNRNPFNYQLDARIDWVQRYGSESFTYFHLGQSEISYDFGKVALSASTQNYEAGPSNFNQIILGRNAAGFPHSRISLEPIDLKIRKKDIGKIEANLIHGLLYESEYFDVDTENDNRYLTGLFVAYQPSFLKDLTLGFNRVMYKQTQYFDTGDLFSLFYNNDSDTLTSGRSTGNDAFDGIASFTLEWKLPNSGFRTYLEYARNDFTGSIRTSLIEPEGGQRAYTIGFEKAIITPKGYVLYIQYEHTNLSRGPVIVYRSVDSSYYTHGVNRQGYTHNGQIIGAGIGPGGSSDNLGLKLIKNDSRIGLLVQRIEANRDYFHRNIQSAELHDQEYTGTIFFAKTKNNLEFIGEVGYSHNFNKYYVVRRNIKNVFGSVGFSFKL